MAPHLPWHCLTGTLNHNALKKSAIWTVYWFREGSQLSFSKPLLHHLSFSLSTPTSSTHLLFLATITSSLSTHIVATTAMHFIHVIAPTWGSLPSHLWCFVSSIIILILILTWSASSMSPEHPRLHCWSVSFTPQPPKLPCLAIGCPAGHVNVLAADSCPAVHLLLFLAPCLVLWAFGFFSR